MSDIKKICLYINNSPRPGSKSLAKLGGGSNSLLSILSVLSTYDWGSHVVVPGEGQFTDVLVEMGIAHTIYPFRPIEWRHPFDTLRTTLDWRRLLQSLKPSIIHANSFDLSRSFALASGSLGIPYISHVRFPMKEPEMQWTLRGLPRPSAFIFNSEAMFNALWPNISKLAPKSRPYVVHNAVDLESFIPAPWPETPPYKLGMIANFSPFKRHEDFLRIAAEMVKVRQDLEFWIVGDDIQGSGRRISLEQLAVELGVSKYVHFLGHRLDIPVIMQQLHLLVVPSQFEPFGRVVIEAMACGRPVVASRDGGIPEIIDDGETGCLVEVGDYVEFSRVALDLLADRKRWEVMSLKAIDAVKSRFSIATHVGRITEIYKEIGAR